MSQVNELLERKLSEVSSRKAKHPLSFNDVPQDDRRIRWSKNHFHVITEIKRSSLSAGAIRPDLHIADLASSFERAGASALSVLTESNYFGGSLDDLRAARRAVSIPILQKDFVIDPYQILEAKIAGAEFVLLIARFLSKDRLAEFVQLCNAIRINALVEITGRDDLEKLTDPVPFLGVNSRDLETLETDLSKFAKLRPLLPDTFLIAESGIHDTAALCDVAALGYNGALIGEKLLRAEDPEKEARAFVQAGSRRQRRSKKLQVKVCGITNERDAMLAVQAGAGALGFIFAESRRRIDPEVLLSFRHRVPGDVLAVGVFRGQPQHEVERLLTQFSFDVAQIYEPMDLPVPTWHARIFNSASNITFEKETSLFDLKLEGASLQEAWRALANRPVFALAGNLHSGNVRQAIEICRPQWVDVARGVETSPGIKDETKLRQFIHAASSPDPATLRSGYFGKYGGRFVPETLMESLLDLERDYFAIAETEAFQKELSHHLKDFAGRPTPLHFASRLTERFQVGDIFLKREDLCHTGAHKINNCVGQALLARHLGKKRIVAETGAGQHGVATAAVCARFGLQCTVYMGTKDVERQHMNVQRMNLFGAEIRPVSQGTQTLKDAINEALRDWITNVESTHYLIGSVVGPHPYPLMVRNFQKVIGEETIQQLAQLGRQASTVLACVGGGSNSIGMFYPFLETRARLIGVEAGGESEVSGRNSATLRYGKPGILHGAYTYLLQRDQGQVEDTESIAPGLDYAAVGPEHSHLKDSGRVEYVVASDQEAEEAFRMLAETEGILAALESCHAVAYLKHLRPGSGTIVVNLSGRGDKDLGIIQSIEARPAGPRPGLKRG